MDRREIASRREGGVARGGLAGFLPPVTTCGLKICLQRADPWACPQA